MEIAVVIINLNGERHWQYMNEHKVIFLLLDRVTSSSCKPARKEWLSQKIPVNNFINGARQAVKRERLQIDPRVMGICGLLSAVRWGRWWLADSYESRVVIWASTRTDSKWVWISCCLAVSGLISVVPSGHRQIEWRKKKKKTRDFIINISASGLVSKGTRLVGWDIGLLNCSAPVQRREVIYIVWTLISEHLIWESMRCLQRTFITFISASKISASHIWICLRHPAQGKKQSYTFNHV